MEGHTDLWWLEDKPVFRQRFEQMGLLSVLRKACSTDG
jgi:hypothetical protein